MRLESPVEDAVLLEAVSLSVRSEIFLEPPVRLEAFLVPAVVYSCDNEFEGDFCCLPSLERSIGDFLEVPFVEIFEGDIP